MRIFVIMLFLISASAQAENLYGWLGCESTQVETSVHECTLLIAQESDKDIQARAYFYRGEAFRRHGDNLRAIADYREALRLSPRLADAYQKMAIVLMRTGDSKEAAENAKKAYALERTQSTANILMALGVIKKHIRDHERTRASDK